MNDTPEFQRFYASVLFREYCVRKRGPLSKRAWGHLMKWAWKARQKARALRIPDQPDLFGDPA